MRGQGYVQPGGGMAAGGIYEQFVQELELYAEGGPLPQSAGWDMKYSMELHTQRLADRGLKIEHKIIPRGHYADKSETPKGWEDAKYISRLEHRSCECVKKYYKGNKLVKDTKQNSLMYQTITDVKYNANIQHEMYTCPGCGTISRVGQLSRGCISCGARFDMSDLYPKVTNYYYEQDIGETPDELGVSLGKAIFGSCGVCMLLMFVLMMLPREKTVEIFVALVTSFIAGGIMGFVVGYIIWMVSKIAAIFKTSEKSSKLAVGTYGSENNYVCRMRQFSPEFSYEYFKDKVVSLLKMIVYARDASRLPNYAGHPIGEMFSDIVDMEYAGAVGLRSFMESNGYICVTVDVYMDVTRDEGQSLKSDSKIFTMKLCKDIRKPVSMYFSIRQISCKSCGAGFDATKDKVCPYCGNIYNVAEDDWIVTEIM